MVAQILKKCSILQHWKTYHDVHNILLRPILRQVTVNHIPKFYFFTIHFNITSQTSSGSLQAVILNLLYPASYQSFVKKLLSCNSKTTAQLSPTRGFVQLFTLYSHINHSWKLRLSRHYVLHGPPQSPTSREKLSLVNLHFRFSVWYWMCIYIIPRAYLYYSPCLLHIPHI
jgi:hypothetical protein